MKNSSVSIKLLSLLLLISILPFASCNKKIDLENFNPQDWRRDFNGCDGTREILMNALGHIKPQLLGIQESQLVEILGKPNKQELGERVKKSYLYYIIPGKQCVFRKNETKILVVDFDALDRVALFSIKIE